MKIVHTADIHLDLCFSASGLPAAFGNRRRQSLRDVFQSIVRRAGEWPADALLIAGDLFEHDRVSRDTVQFLLSQFRSIPEVGVFIAPGNHDRYVSDSPYATENWPKNVTIFSKPRWTSFILLDGALTIHGFGFDGPHLSSNPFGALHIPSEARDRVHVALAHGSERTHQPPDKDAYAPFDARDAAAEGLDYLALGHFHSVTPIEGDFSTRMYYSGAPEGHNLREEGTHHYLEVEIDNGGVRVRPVPSSRIVYSSHRLACDHFESAQDIVEAVRAIANTEETRQVARIILSGSLEPSIKGQLGHVYDAALMDFEHLYLIDKTAPGDDYEEFVREETSLGAFVRTLNHGIEDADEAHRQKLVRAREVGVAAFRRRDVEIRGLERV